jgi:predicted phage terminase large subunit-like protein
MPLLETLAREKLATYQTARARKIGEDREAVAGGGLKAFLQLAWSLIEPARYVDGWHVDEICAHLEAVTRGEIQRLIINIPPGSMKSLTVCAFWPAWTWTEWPETKWIFASYSAGLSRRDGIRHRSLVESEWFHDRWPGLYIPRQNTRSATDFANNRGGFRFSTSVQGGVTGRHADVQVVDDPTKPMDVMGGRAVTRTQLNFVRDWWTGTMPSRLANPKKSARVIIMQRLHEADLAGVMEATGDYVVLRLPMRFEKKNPSRTIVGGDRRTEDGELLWPQRFPEPVVAQLEKDMGAMVTAAQLQQRPTPASGGIFKREWFLKRWHQLPAGIRLIQSWDMRFKDDAESGDWVVGQIWGAKDGEFYLVDQVRARASFEETCKMVQDFTAKWPRALLKLVEDKANGPAVQNTLKKKIRGIVLINPEGGKIARANAVTPILEAGNVWFPAEAPWMGAFVEEATGFPMGVHDDQVDGMTQALLRLDLRSPAVYTAAMDRVAHEMLSARSAPWE